MQLKKFTHDIEKQIYQNLEELYEKANLTETEREIFDKYKKYCEYWLLRAKEPLIVTLDDSPNFIQKMARVLINLQSPYVTGQRDHLVKEMFGDKKVHRCYKTKNGLRSTISSNKVFNTYFELKIMSFLLENKYSIELSTPEHIGHKIPEFVAIKDSKRLNVEAKNLDVDKIMDHIFGDVFIDGIEYRPTKEDRNKGYLKIKSTVETNYENALQKYNQIPVGEYFILFLSGYYKISHMGSATVEFINNLCKTWENEKYEYFAGVVLPEDENTYFIANKSCDFNNINIVEEFSKFHSYQPKTLVN